MVALSCFVIILTMTAPLISAKKLPTVLLRSPKIEWKQFTALWEKVTNATSYETALTCNQQTFNETVIIETVTYKQVPSNESCIFEVKALNSVDDTSDVKQYGFLSAAAPAVPGNLTIINHPDNKYTQLYLTWDHPASFSADRLKTIRYQISYKTSTHELAVKLYAITDPEAKTYTLKDLDENTIYWVEVSAYDETTKEVGGAAKGEQLTKKSGMSNVAIALITIGLTIAVITALVIGTYMHFKKTYSHV